MESSEMRMTHALVTASGLVLLMGSGGAAVHANPRTRRQPRSWHRLARRWAASRSWPHSKRCRCGARIVAKRQCRAVVAVADRCSSR